MGEKGGYWRDDALHRQIMISRRRRVRLAQAQRAEQGDAGWEIALCAIGAVVGREPAGAEPPRGGAWVEFDWKFLRFVSYPQIRWSEGVLNRC